MTRSHGAKSWTSEQNLISVTPKKISSFFFIWSLLAKTFKNVQLHHLCVNIVELSYWMCFRSSSGIVSIGNGIGISIGTCTLVVISIGIIIGVGIGQDFVLENYM